MVKVQRNASTEVLKEIIYNFITKSDVEHLNLQQTYIY